MVKHTLSCNSHEAVLTFSFFTLSARMSELIKENKSEHMIDMARLRLFAILGIIFVSILLSSPVQSKKPMATAGKSYSISQTVPDIWGWESASSPPPLLIVPSSLPAVGHHPHKKEYP